MFIKKKNVYIKVIEHNDHPHNYATARMYGIKNIYENHKIKQNTNTGYYRLAFTTTKIRSPNI